MKQGKKKIKLTIYGKILIYPTGKNMGRTHTQEATLGHPQVAIAWTAKSIALV